MSFKRFLKYTVATPYPVGPVNFYLLKADPFLVMVDSGPFSRQSIEYLEKNVDFRKIKYLLITHCHPDHYGLCDYISKKGIEVFISEKDIIKLNNNNIDKEIGYLKDAFSSFEFPENLISNIVNSIAEFEKTIPFPAKVNILEKHDFKDIEIEFEPYSYHSLSDIVYFYDNYAITGDILLNGIFQTPLIEIDLNSDKKLFDNYSAFCNTLLKMKKLYGYNILAGHGKVDNVKEAVIFYVNGILERTFRIKYFLENSFSIYEITSKILEQNAVFLRYYIKASEVLFFKNFLNDPAKLRNSLIEIGLFEHLKTKFESVISC